MPPPLHSDIDAARVESAIGPLNIKRNADLNLEVDAHPTCVGMLLCNWSGASDRVRDYAAAGIQGWPSVSMTRASKKCSPCLAAVER
jgi:hypothetical protein